MGSDTNELPMPTMNSSQQCRPSTIPSLICQCAKRRQGRGISRPGDFAPSTAKSQHQQNIGKQGKTNGGVYQFVVPRAERLADDGMPVPATMGTGTAINLQPLGG